MNEDFMFDADACYRLAERKAGSYLAALSERIREQSHLAALTEDLRQWQRRHVRGGAWLSFLSRGKKPAADGADDRSYISWLNRTGKIDQYLDRSISYIYLRDLGKRLDAPDTEDRIRRVAADVKRRLLRTVEAGQGERSEFFGIVELYRWAQKEGVEAAVIWAIDKLKKVEANIPEGMNAEHAQRKLIKITIGVVLHAIEEMGADRLPAERSRMIDEAIRLGYSYGLTYPFIDDLLDSKALTPQEKSDYARIIREALRTGTVPEWSGEAGTNSAAMRFISAELREAFEYIKRSQRPERRRGFFEQTYIFFHAQESDRAKDLAHAGYTNEELYVPIIVKSAYSRLVARSVVNAPQDAGFEERTFYYGLYNQLADDFADLFEDLKDGAVTPFTYYWTYRDRRPDLLNPFELYWTVILHLIHHVFRSDAKTREVILSRAINGLKRYRARVGEPSYRRVIDTFAFGGAAFGRLLHRFVRKADDVDFLDKLLRDQWIANLVRERKVKEHFFETIRTAREQVNSTLQIVKPDGAPPMKGTLIDAANYSLAGDGKRLRPVLTLVMGVQEYGLQAASIEPLLRSLEYMHTASLVFDDLPSQDNASIRRGRSTLHRIHDSATAELTGLYLIQKAIQEQASLRQFDANAVLELIRYSARAAEDLCMGQAMDLRAKGQALTLEQLDTICYYKTGVAFEAALVMPAILAKAGERSVAALKTFAYHAGIAFQIRDDLLDAGGDAQALGKPVGQDVGNNASTFVTVLGREGAEKEMWRHYCDAMDALKELPHRTAFLRHLLDYMIHRDR